MTEEPYPVMDSPKIVLLSADDIGHDVLLVTALVGDSEEPIEALGWVSAMTNHHGPQAYLTEGESATVERDGRTHVIAEANKGHRHPDAKPGSASVRNRLIVDVA